ncbi:MAG: hypothetical protein KDD43_02160 [Bdellovibrionales bacterium]|nr:hypothetical protein [Bdellovibrionales bacterium]
MKLRNLPRFSFPAPLVDLISANLQRAGFSYERPETLAQAILALSDLYNSKGGSDQVWTRASHRAAYWGYFLPLNFLRLQAVVEEGQRLGFFTDLDHLVDFGSGPGTGHLVWELTENLSPLQKLISIEASSLARDQHQTWTNSLKTRHPFRLIEGRDLPPPPTDRSLALLSYSLNELGVLPSQLYSYSHILIVEPSTREAGRKLMTLRQELIDKGFSIWAPCPHQQQCPLLSQSKQDWCHDRILIERPTWMVTLEQSLPLDNRSLTFSYLMACRQSPGGEGGLARVIGDTRKEKGKTRQAVCRGPKREFLAWLKKEGQPPIIPRGALVRLPSDSPSKGNEVRPQGNVDLVSCHRQNEMA